MCGGGACSIFNFVYSVLSVFTEGYAGGDTDADLLCAKNTICYSTGSRTCRNTFFRRVGGKRCCCVLYAALYEYQRFRAQYV